MPRSKTTALWCPMTSLSTPEPQPTTNPKPENEIMKGISTNRRTTNHVACLRHAGIDFIARYYSTTTHQTEKRLTLSEAQAISAAGMTIVAVYEDGPTNVGYFSTSRGH